jgi:hypothetical protein
MQTKLTSFITVATITAIGLLTGCGGSTPEPKIGTDINYSFAQNTDGWEVGYSDYSTLTKPTDVEQVHAVIPIPGASKALYMGATNLSDDLLLYTYRKVTGLLPNNSYTGQFTVTFASDAPAGCAGVGGGGQGSGIRGEPVELGRLGVRQEGDAAAQGEGCKGAGES